MKDSYDLEFGDCLRRVKTLIMKMRDKEDQRLCSKWVKRLIKLQSNDLEVKKNRNEFFKFMLEVIQEDALAGSLSTIPDPRYFPCNPGEEADCNKGDDPLIMTHWSDDGRTYIAIKTLPNNGAIIYMAVSSDPDLGWDIPK